MISRIVKCLRYNRVMFGYWNKFGISIDYAITPPMGSVSIEIQSLKDYIYEPLHSYNDHRLKDGCPFRYIYGSHELYIVTIHWLSSRRILYIYRTLWKVTLNKRCKNNCCRTNNDDDEITLSLSLCLIFKGIFHLKVITY